MHCRYRVAAALLWMAGCGSPASAPICHPVGSWASPAFACAPSTAPPVEAEVEAEPAEATEPQATDTAPIESAPDVHPSEVVPPVAPRATATNDAIEVSETIEFELGSARLTPRSKTTLDEVAAILRNNRAILKLQIEGYTDSKASHARNRNLSTGRAKAVRRYLITKGIAPHRLTAKGFGEKSPIADNATEEGRRKNRRVEFKILKRKK